MDVGFLRKLYLLHELPIFVSDRGQCVFRLPESENSVLEEDPLLLQSILEQSDLLGGRPFLFLDDHLFCFACMKKEETVCIIGPAARKEFTPEEASAFCAAHHLEPGRSFQVFSMGAATRYLSMIWYVLTGKDMDYRDVTLRIPRQEIVLSGWNVEWEMEKYQLSRSDLNQTHDAMEFENELLQQVASGNVERMQELMYTDVVSKDDFGQVSRIPLKQTEYMMVSLITLMTRAAAAGGMRPEEAYQLGDIYLQQISSCVRAEQMTMITLHAQYDFTQRVAKARKVKSQYAFIEQCKDYIEKNLRKPFQISEIAPAIGLSRTYLAKKFSEVEGITIQQYVVRERCRHAANMLRHSDAPISQIANYFCFSSQSHFGKHFREIYGVTPKEYREQETSANLKSNKY